MKKALLNDDWQFSLDGKSFCPVTLPHDARQTSGRAAAAPSGGSGAYYLGGCYTYTKALTLSADQAAGSVQLLFDGVYRKTEVRVNGTHVGGACYGYTSFLVDCSDHVRAGENAVEVIVHAEDEPSSRWYSGAGIYRNVWLLTAPEAHIEPFGLRVATVSYEPAVLHITTVHSGGDCVKVTVWDNDTPVAATQGDDVELTVPDAHLWSDKSPYLYRCTAELYRGGKVVDNCETAFGIRALRWDTTGFYVNGQRTMLRGGCIHHDNGILGAVSLPEWEERRLLILKDAGFNAIRSAHNPASTALLDACDRLGLYVMDEGWDMWYTRKSAADYGQDFPAHWQDDVTAMTRRGFNHPSIVLYSIGNEVTEPHDEKGIAQGREIAALFRRLDPTRPVTIGLNMALLAMSAMGFGLYDNVDQPVQKRDAAANSAVFNATVNQNRNLVMASCKPEVDALCTPILEAVDIAGYNYGVPRYPLDAKAHPNRVVVGSETFPHELAATWKLLENCPYVIGDFMWTAWDYMGECGIGTWAHSPDALEFDKPYPWKLADVGAFDLIGTPTGEALWVKAVWCGKTSLAVRPVPYPSETLARGAWRGTNAVPGWSWQGCDGIPAEVEVYTPAPTAALYLNGQLVAKQKTRDMRALFTLPYAPGILEAAALDADEQELVRTQLTSAQGPLHWTLHPEAPLHKGQTAFVDVALTDDAGNIECNADATLTVQVDGGKLLGFGSAEPRTACEFAAGEYDIFGNIEWTDEDKVKKQINDIIESVRKDERYNNAMQYSDKQNARDESDRAAHEAVLNSMQSGLELFREVQNNPSFRKWLFDSAFNSTYQTNSQQHP